MPVQQQRNRTSFWQESSPTPDIDEDHKGSSASPTPPSPSPSGAPDEQPVQQHPTSDTSGEDFSHLTDGKRKNH